MIKKIVSIMVVLNFVLLLAGCKAGGDKLPTYSQKSFEISGFWAPYELTEQSFKQYKDIGFTTFNMINHSLDKDSENQFYLGSERTKKALELCRKTGLNAILNYNDWVATWSENDENYYTDKPFSQYDIYGDYKDIITGIHIADEPSKHHYDIYAQKTMIDDFQKVYPDAHYILNLPPKHAGGTYWKFDTYDELVNTYEERIMPYLDNSFISFDCYPFINEKNPAYPRRDTWLSSYEIIANLGKKYNSYKTAIIQSSVTNEFAQELTEDDMRMQVNIALAFGFDHIQYYCYEVPKAFNEDGSVEYMYEHSILNKDSTPTDMYYWLQGIHKEIQSFSSVILAYDWDAVMTTNPVGFSSNQDVMTMMDRGFEGAKHFEKALASGDLAITRFTSDKYGEAYMLVNYALKDKPTNVATITFKDCSKVAVYGGKGFDGTPQIVELDEENKYRVELPYGDGVFVVPIA